MYFVDPATRPESGVVDRIERSFKLFRFDTLCSRITAHLFLSGVTPAMSRSTLAVHQISQIVNCAGMVCPNHFANELSYCTYNLLDTPGQSIVPLFYETRALIDKAWAEGRRTLVHCHQGVSRSATVVIAYMMATYNMNVDSALRAVRAARGIAAPNAGFLCQLIAWDGRLKRGRSVLAAAARAARGEGWTEPCPPVLYLMAPLAPTEPRHFVPREVQRGALDRRGVYVLQDTREWPLRTLLWVGPCVPSSVARPALAAALALCRYLAMYEGASTHVLVDESLPAGAAGDGRCAWAAWAAAAGVSNDGPEGLTDLDEVSADLLLATGEQPAPAPAPAPAPTPALASAPIPASVSSLSFSDSSSDYSYYESIPETPPPKMGLGLRLNLGLGIGSGPAPASSSVPSTSESEDDSAVLSSFAPSRPSFALYDAEGGWTWSATALFDADDLMPDGAALLRAPARGLAVFWVGAALDPEPSAVPGRGPGAAAVAWRGLAAFAPAAVADIDSDARYIDSESDEVDIDAPADAAGKLALVVVADCEPEWLLDLLDDP